MSGERLRALMVVVVVLVVGAFLGSALSRRWVEPEPAGPADGGPAERVRVEVLNGGGRSGMARAATDALRDRGYDVVYYGNAGAFSGDASVVVDRVGRIDLARDVADELSIRDVTSEPDSNLYLDVTVVLGGEWSPSVPPASTPEQPWWDLRRFFRADSAQPAASGSSGQTG